MHIFIEKGTKSCSETDKIDLGTYHSVSNEHVSKHLQSTMEKIDSTVDQVDSAAVDANDSPVEQDDFAAIEKIDSTPVDKTGSPVEHFDPGFNRSMSTPQPENKANSKQSDLTDAASATSKYMTNCASDDDQVFCKVPPSDSNEEGGATIAQNTHTLAHTYVSRSTRKNENLSKLVLTLHKLT